MDRITFSTAVRFTPNLLNVPEAYLGVSFADLDFSDNAVLKEFLITYLKNFTVSSDKKTYDSLIIGTGEMAFKILVSIYREVGSRITVESCKFINWPIFVSELRSAGWQAEHRLHEGMEYVKFLFIFDLNFLHKESITYFCELLDACYTQRIRLFIATRDLSVVERLPESYCTLSKQKLWAVKINDK